METSTSTRASKPAKAKRAAKNAAETRAESPSTPVVVGSNPYLAVVHKKLRSLKKKSERIKALEQEIAASADKSAASLNQEQVALLKSKSSVERSIVDIEALKAQLEEVAATEAISQPAAGVVEQKEAEPEAVQEPVAAEPDTQEAAVAAAPETVHEHTQADGAGGKDVEAMLTQLLKLVHVSTRSSVLTAGPVPIEINFLVQSILGQTLLPHVTFEEGILQSVHQAQAFIEGSELVVVQDRTFRQIAAHVEELINPPKNVEAAVEQVQAEPEFNFFAHEQPHDDNDVASFQATSGAHSAFNGAVPSAWVGMPSHHQTFDGEATAVEATKTEEATQSGKEERADGHRRGGQKGRGSRRAGRGGNRDGKESKEGKDGKEAKEGRDHREGKPARGNRESKQEEGAAARPPRERGEHGSQKQQGRPHKPRNPRPQGDKPKGQAAGAAASKPQQAQA